MNFRSLSSSALATRLRELLGDERDAQVAFLLHLDEFDRRVEWQRLGYARLWNYCREELGLLDGAIHRRTTAIGILRRVPQVVDYLRDGRMSMTTLALLRDVITPENYAEILSKASNKSRMEVEELVVAITRPSPVPEASAVRRLPTASVLEIKAPDEAVCETRSVVPDTGTNYPRDVSRAPDPPLAVERAEIAPVSAERWQVKLTVNREFMETLERAREILSHVVPDGNALGVVKRALEEIVRADERKRQAKKARVRAEPVQVLAQVPAQEETVKKEKGTRVAIPAAVEREVRARDGNCCSWKTARGVCGSRWQMELDHVVPLGKGGETSVANLRVLCRAHNGEHARRCFGRAFMQAREGRATSAGGSGRASASGSG